MAEAEIELKELPCNPKTQKKKHVLRYLYSKKEELDLDEEDISIFEKNKTSGFTFINLTYEKLIDENGKYRLPDGPAFAISKLISDLNISNPNNTTIKKKPFNKYTLKDLASILKQKYNINCNEKTAIKEIPEFKPGFRDVKNNLVFKRCVAEIEVTIHNFYSTFNSTLIFSTLIFHIKWSFFMS